MLKCLKAREAHGLPGWPMKPRWYMHVSREAEAAHG